MLGGQVALCIVSLLLVSTLGNGEHMAQNIPPEGLYMVLRSDLINQIGAEMSLYVADEANQYTQTPPITGSTSDVTYTLSSFTYDVNLAGFTWSVPADQKLTLQWSNFAFIVQFNYHVCLKAWPNPCESGYIQVYTTAGGKVSVSVSVDVNLLGPTVSLTASSVSLQIGQNSAEIYVSCSDIICIIPTSDIANAVSSGFVPSFQSAAQTTFNKVVASTLGTIPTTMKWSTIGLNWQLQTDFTETNKNLIFYAKATVVNDKHPQPPPFSPTFVPPLSEFQNPPGLMDVFYTDYSIRSAFWALNSLGYFDRVITNSELPPNSPYKLNTNDFYFRLFVPGLAAYPNMNITIGTSLVRPVNVTLTPLGMIIDTLVSLNFSLQNSTKQVKGWLLHFELSAIMSFQTQNIGNNITISPGFSGWLDNTTLVSSSVGSVAASSIGGIISTVVQLLMKPPVEVITVVPGFIVTQTKPTFETGFGIVSTSVGYTPAPAVQCPDSSKCALRNTCCKWSSGYGCCTLPNASCCAGSGCCPQGSVCDGGECYDNITKKKISDVFLQ